MNQNELIDAIHVDANIPTDQPAITKSDIKRVLNSLAEVAATYLGTEDGEIPLPGIGKLKADIRAARTGRNPATGAAIDIPAKNVVKFVMAKSLKDALA